MKIRYGIFTGLLVASLVVSTASAQNQIGVVASSPALPMMWMGDGPGMMLPLLLRGLDLTDNQWAQIKTIMSNNRGKLRPLFKQLQAAHEEVANKFLAPGEVSRDDLVPQLQQMEQLRGQLMEEGLTVMFEVRKILTPEQLAKAAQLRERMQTLHKEMDGLFFNKKVSPPDSDEPEGDVMFFEHP